MSRNWLSRRIQLEKEDERPRRAVADLTLDKHVPTELDLSFDPLADLRPLAALPTLEPLGPNGMAADLRAAGQAGCGRKPHRGLVAAGGAGGPEGAGAWSERRATLTSGSAALR